MRRFDPSFLPKTRVDKEFVLPDRPLDLEIGCGTGLFALKYAELHPERYLVAIEHTREKYRKFAELHKTRAELTNLEPIHANAISWVSQQLRAETVEKFFLLYPNPNPKLRHLNKRWHAMPFMEKLIEVLKPAGEITLVTNEEFYFTEAKEYLTDVWKLDEKEAFHFDSSHPQAAQPRTLFEKKYLERGETCYQLVVVKP